MTQNTIKVCEDLKNDVHILKLYPFELVTKCFRSTLIKMIKMINDKNDKKANKVLRRLG